MKRSGRTIGIFSGGIFSGSIFSGILTCFLSMLSSPALAETPPGAVYLNGYWHSESRESVTKSNFELSLGYDRFLSADGPFYAGPRLGFYREQLLTFTQDVQTKPFLGAHAYWLPQVSPGFFGKLGAAVDILKGDDTDPLYLYLGAEGGLRAELTQAIYAEVPAELGFFPFFDGIPVFFKVGLQLGYRF